MAEYEGLKKRVAEIQRQMGGLKYDSQREEELVEFKRRKAGEIREVQEVNTVEILSAEKEISHHSCFPFSLLN